MPESRGANLVGKVWVIGCMVWLVACGQPPIKWAGPAVPRGPAETIATPKMKTERRLCPGTVRFAFGADSLVYAAWWTKRPDSSAILRVARSIDGGKRWEAAVSADERDRSVRGCSRPPPAIAYDADSGYLHLTYYLEPPEGSGIFYEHLMKGMFHAPLVIVYGERPVVAAVSAAGDTVVVAYEDPNRRTPQVMLAISYTAGHLFETRVSASGDDVDARAPDVRVKGGRVTVGWYETGVRGEGDDDSQSGLRAVPVTRQGVLTGGR
jgi:hypothetical protein